MSEQYTIFAINPGSTSTKVALFRNEEQIFKRTVSHNDQVIASFARVWDQYAYRKEQILGFLQEESVELGELSCVVGRGGLFRPTISGTYAINKAMLSDARACFQGEHASNLGCVLAYGIAWDLGIPSYIVDPPCVDEMEDVARLSGHSAIQRRSLHHALNIKAVARRTADELGKDLAGLNLVIAHIGGGISVVPLRHGRMIDTNNALSGGPFSAERTGSLPMMDFVEYMFDKELSKNEADKMIVGNGGMISYLGTKSIAEAAEKAEAGDVEARLVLRAMAYQIAKEISGMSAALKGKVDGIVLTGGGANCSFLTDEITGYINYLSPVYLYPGEDEMSALALGALRVLQGKEEPLSYPLEIAPAAAEQDET